MASFTCERAVAFCRQFSTRSCQLVKELTGHLLHLGTLYWAQLRCRPSQNVEHHQLFFGQTFPYMALLLIVEGAAEGGWSGLSGLSRLSGLFC